MRFVDADEDIVYWYHGIDVHGQPRAEDLRLGVRRRLTTPSRCTSRSTRWPARRRPTASPATRASCSDIEQTVELFDRFFLDRDKGGYFSHLDPVTLDPRAESLGRNRAKKNWNSVGDHAPAYLINLYLATGEERYADFLEYTFDTIAKYFPDYEHSPFVQERFFEDWSHDTTWGWQQNRAVVGHNLKIAWNLMRMHQPAPERPSTSRWRSKIARDHAGGRQRPAARRLVRRGGAQLKAGAGVPPLRRGTTARPGGSRSRRSWPT